LQKASHKLTHKFIKHKKLTKNALEKFLVNEKNDIIDGDLYVQILMANGYPIYEKDDCFYLKTLETSLREETFCFVDIEANGSKPENGQIIEIAGVKVKDGQIIDKFNSLIYNAHIPLNIQEITNITPDLLVGAPKIGEVLQKFKLFLGESIFIAHGVTFDYNFISYYLDKMGLGILENRYICTVKLAQKTIPSQKYSLRFFNEYFALEQDNLHRAYSDAYLTYQVFTKCLEHIERELITTEDLIKFVY